MPGRSGKPPGDSSPQRDQAGVARRGVNKWWALIVLDLSVFMVLMDNTIVNIAIPRLASDLGASFAQAEWVINGFTLSFAVFMITFGRLGDMWGRRRIFLIGLVLFTLSSGASALTATVGMLILARVAQGVGGAMMMPQTLSLLTVTFPREQRGLAMGLWGAVGGIATILGPVLGGLILHGASWRWIFFVNVPIGIITIIGTLLIVRESTAPGAQSVDIAGVVTSSLTLFALIFALIEGTRYGWTSPLILSLFAVFVAGAVLFYLIERDRENALVHLDIFRNRTFSAGIVATLILMFGLLAIDFLVPIVLQTLLHYSALKTGLVLAPASAMYVFVTPGAGKLSDVIGGRWPSVAGMVICGLGIYWLAHLAPGLPWLHVLGPLIVFGIGIGMMMAPLTSVVMGQARAERVGNAAGILATDRQIGSSLGIATMGAVFVSLMTTNLRQAVEALHLPPGEKERLMQEITARAHEIAVSGARGGGLPAPTPQVARLLEDQLLKATNTTFLAVAAVFGLGAIAALFIQGEAGQKSVVERGEGKGKREKGKGRRGRGRKNGGSGSVGA